MGPGGLVLGPFISPSGLKPSEPFLAPAVVVRQSKLQPILPRKMTQHDS